MGEVAAVVTSVCWSFTGIFFTIGGRRVGSHVVNMTRLLLAFAIMLVVHRLALGAWLPLDAGAERWGWLALSGVIGLALGDAALFQSMVLIGPRLATLLMALVPVLSTLFAWVLLRETLSPVDSLAVVITVGGIVWVVLERHTGANHTPAPGRLGWGVALGICAALGQSLGLITSRLGLAGNFPVISANLMRILGGGLALWAVSGVAGMWRRPFAALGADRQAAAAIVGGTLVGPVIGIMLSLVAIQRAPIGIASTLMSLTPITILPLVAWVFKEQVSRRTLGGTVLALVGVGLIFLW